MQTRNRYIKSVHDHFSFWHMLFFFDYLNIDRAQNGTIFWFQIGHQSQTTNSFGKRGKSSSMNTKNNNNNNKQESDPSVKLLACAFLIFQTNCVTFWMDFDFCDDPVKNKNGSISVIDASFFFLLYQPLYPHYSSTKPTWQCRHAHI